MSDSNVQLLLKAQDQTAGAFDSLTSRLGNIKTIAEGTFAGMLVMKGLDTVVDGVKDFASGLISSNAGVETLNTSLTALYGSASEANQALEYMNQLSQAAPFKRQDILDAGQAIASYGQDITAVLPALGNIAAVMGVDLPNATQALEMAMTGRLCHADAHLAYHACRARTVRALHQQDDRPGQLPRIFRES